MKLQTAFFYNIAPFEKMYLEFNDRINVLTGFNGSGKTTIISYIVDAIYELAKKANYSDFKGVETKFYRVTSQIDSFDLAKPSVVYLRFKLDDINYYDYIYLNKKIDRSSYYSLIEIENSINYDKIENALKNEDFAKLWSIDEHNKIRNIFETNILTYFPSYRFEKPLYLTELYAKKIKLYVKQRILNYLPNPIENISTIGEITNWMLDILLDSYLLNSGDILKELNHILDLFIYKLDEEQCVLGLGKRNSGLARLAVFVKNEVANYIRTIYPTIFCMSSGELAIFCLFSELIRQADKISKTITEINGLVLIDEIDKHLHIKFQKEILPKLIKHFPNIQFIISSHSPFFNLGLEDNFRENESIFKIFDLNNNGIEISASDTNVFREAYEIMINKNEQFKILYDKLVNIVKENSKTLIITEGPSDWKHLKAAYRQLLKNEDFKNEINNLNIEFLEYEPKEAKEDGNLRFDMGYDDLEKMCRQWKKYKQKRKIIFISDSDKIPDTFNDQNSDGYKDQGNNVYSIVIPNPTNRVSNHGFSIEHYYTDSEIKTKFLYNNKELRLYMGNEFDEDGESIVDNLRTQAKNKCGENKICIIDSSDKVYRKGAKNNNLALKKNMFGEFVLNRHENTQNFSFDEFVRIFKIIKVIDTLPLT